MHTRTWMVGIGLALALPLSAQAAADNSSRWETLAQQILHPELRAANQTGPIRCLTPALVDLYRHRDALQPATRDAYLARARPTVAEDPLPSVGKIVSTRLPITVHYRLSSQVSQAEKVLKWAEESWDREVTELGFAVPLKDDGVGGDDNLDYYLATEDETGGGAYTQPTYRDANPSDDRLSCPSYIALNEELSDEVMPVYVSHEFNHVLQAATDYWEISWAWEATATFIEDETYDSVNDYYWYIPYFQGYPEQNLVFFGDSDPFNIYPYGGSVFMHFMNEALSAADASVSVDLWEASVQKTEDNEPDFIDALDEVSKARGWSGGIQEAYTRFTQWRYFTGSRDDGNHFKEGSDWGEDSEVPVTDLGSWKDLPETLDLDGVSELGAVLFEVDLTGIGAEQSITVSVDAPYGTRWSLAALRLKSGSTEEIILGKSAQDGGIDAGFAAKDATKLVVGVINAGSTTYDADYEPEEDSATVSISVDGDGGGCGCSTSPRSTTGSLAWGALGLMWIFSRRRSPSRR